MKFAAFVSFPFLLSALASAEPAPRPAGEVFGHQVLPIFQQRCLKCHGDGKTKGGLDLTTFAAALKGGESGDAIVPGKSRASLIYQQIVDKEMPPEGEEPITYEELQIISKWIDSSAFPDPATLEARASASVHERARGLWSFRPPARPALPEVKDATRVRSPIDRFVLAKLEATGLRFRLAASDRTLVRRVYFNLIGLPPTPEQIEAFVNDARPDAWERLVESLLASPHYGERWGRHWLDAAGWAESSLLIADAVRPGYWRYRDWVIRAFNDDQPYDQFVREQLAGDEMVNWRNAEHFNQETIDKLTATGFLRCPPDGTDNQLITQEEKRFAAQQTAVEVATKALLGLTMNCTRCHDHKYDPVTQQEYYELIAIFQPAYDPEKWIPGMVNQFGAGPVRAIPIADRKGREEFQRRMEELGRQNAELSYQKENGIPNKYRDRYLREHLDEIPASFDRERIEQALKREERQRGKEGKGGRLCRGETFQPRAGAAQETVPRNDHRAEGESAPTEGARGAGDAGGRSNLGAVGRLDEPFAGASAHTRRVQEAGARSATGHPARTRSRGRAMACARPRCRPADHGTPPRFRRLAGAPGASAHRARDGEPHLAIPLRHRPRCDAGRLRHAGRKTVPPGVARLARARVHRVGLVDQAPAPANCELHDVSAERERSRR